MDNALQELWALINSDSSVNIAEKKGKLDQATLLWHKLGVEIKENHEKGLKQNSLCLARLLQCARIILHGPKDWQIESNDCLEMAANLYGSIFQVIAFLVDTQYVSRRSLAKDKVAKLLIHAVESNRGVGLTERGIIGSLHLLVNIASDPSTLQGLISFNIVQMVYGLLQRYPLPEGVITSGLQLLYILVSCTDVRKEAVREDVVQLVLSSMEACGTLTATLSGLRILYHVADEVVRKVKVNPNIIQQLWNVLLKQEHEISVLQAGLHLLARITKDDTCAIDIVTSNHSWNLLLKLFDCSDKWKMQVISFLFQIFSNLHVHDGLTRHTTSFTREDGMYQQVCDLTERVEQWTNGRVDSSRDFVLEQLLVLQLTFSNESPRANTHRSRHHLSSWEGRSPQSTSDLLNMLQGGTTKHTPKDSRSHECKRKRSDTVEILACEDSGEIFTQVLRELDANGLPTAESSYKIRYEEPARENDFINSKDCIDSRKHINLTRAKSTEVRDSSHVNAKPVQVDSATSLGNNPDYSELQEKYRMATRRAREQARLLEMQNERLERHLEEREQQLQKIKALEDECKRLRDELNVHTHCQSAQLTSSSQIMKEFQATKQELDRLKARVAVKTKQVSEKERLRVDSHQRVSTLRQEKQALELERDNVQLQLQIFQCEHASMLQELTDVRRECAELLYMREEDHDALPFIEKVKASSPHRKSVSPTKTRQRMSTLGYLWLPSDEPLQRRRSSMPNLADFARAQNNTKPMETQSPPRPNTATLYEPKSTTSLLFDERELRGEEVMNQLRSIYMALEAASRGVGVHQATIRRLFLESGLVEPPLIAGDVDVILSKILVDVYERQKDSIRRKDYRFEVVPKRQTNPGKRSMSRHFKFKGFCKAVTYVASKRYPREDPHVAFQIAVTETLYPFFRKSISSNKADHASTSTGVLFRVTKEFQSYSTGVMTLLRAIITGLTAVVGCERQRLLFTATLGSNEMHMNATDVVYAMQDMHTILVQEQKALILIADTYYNSLGNHNKHLRLEHDMAPHMSYDTILQFALDFEIVPPFIDRNTLRKMYSETGSYIKRYFAKYPQLVQATDHETLAKASFLLLIARLAMELFHARFGYETPQKQILALLQWLDHSTGREKIYRQCPQPLAIRFSSNLYSS